MDLAKRSIALCGNNGHQSRRCAEISGSASAAAICRFPAGSHSEDLPLFSVPYWTLDFIFYFSKNLNFYV
jgi:hypothetical protein